MQSNEQLLVSGKILIGKDVGTFSSATVNVYLEDVSLQGASAKIIAKQTIPNVIHERGTDTTLEFVLYGGKPDQGASYSIRAHVDFHGVGHINRGDYISMQSYPVLTFGHPNKVEVTVHEVK